MAFERSGDGALDYMPCRYGASKLLFRGPRRRLEGDFIAFLGGSETYGKFVPEPFATLVERQTGLVAVNFGTQNAGADLYLNEPGLIEICNRAAATVVQVVGAHNMSNRYYSVHPRRNDRFLRTSSLMNALFRDVDFTEFHFTRHLLLSLRRRAPERYQMVEAELKSAWVARTRQLLGRLTGRTVLLWLHDPKGTARDDLGAEPLLVDPGMVAAVRDAATDLVEVTPSLAARAAGDAGMVFGALEAPAAGRLPGPAVHAEVAAALAPLLLRTS